jgi:hypothetical protein
MSTSMYFSPVVYTHPDSRDYYASDIYAFRIILWNVLSCNGRPHEDIDLIRIVEGERPPMDGVYKYGTPEKLCELMKECWDSLPSRRPKASDVHQRLVEVLIHRIGCLAFGSLPVNDENKKYLGKPDMILLLVK